MDNSEQAKKISGLEFETVKTRNDYNFLVQKLKSIKEVINLLEKSFTERDKSI